MLLKLFRIVFYILLLGQVRRCTHKPANPCLFCYGIIAGISLICNQFYAAKQIPEQPVQPEQPSPNRPTWDANSKRQTTNDNWGKIYPARQFYLFIFFLLFVVPKTKFQPFYFRQHANDIMCILQKGPCHPRAALPRNRELNCQTGKLSGPLRVPATQH